MLATPIQGFPGRPWQGRATRVVAVPPETVPSQRALRITGSAAKVAIAAAASSLWQHARGKVARRAGFPGSAGSAGRRCPVQALEPQESGLLYSVGSLHEEVAGPAETADDDFSAFVRMRCGAGAGQLQGEMPPHIFWFCTGELYARPGGEVLAKVEGFDVSVAVQHTKNKVVQLSRKIFFYKDVTTGEVMLEYKGQPVKPIKYDYQVIEYTLDANGSIVPSVVQGQGARRRTIPGMPIRSMAVGPDQRVFQAPLFIDAEIPGRGRYQAWENYDFSVDVTGERPAHMTWVRQGVAPPFSMDATGAIMHLVGRRLESFEELPASMKEIVIEERSSEDYRLFRHPPQSVDEIEQLQRPPRSE